MKIYTVQEYGELEIDGLQLTGNEREYLAKMQTLTSPSPFTYWELKGKVRFEFSSWVGVLELEQSRIAIKPKFKRGFNDLVDLLLFVEEIPLNIDNDGLSDFDKNSLMELLTKLYVKEAEILLNKGIRKEYITESDNLSLLRGRIDIRQHLNINKVTASKIYCHYDELDTNILDNQVIRFGLEVAQRFSLSKETKKAVHRLLDEFSSLTDTFEHSGQWPTFSYNRLNQHYENVHKLAFYLWKQVYMNDIYQMRHQSHFSLLLDMNELFERFVTQLLKKYLPKDTKVLEQKRFKKAIVRNGSSYRDIIPDILIQYPQGHKLVIDTKYKPYGQKKVSNQDMYQLLFYSQFIVGENGSPHSLIIFPQYEGEEMVEEKMKMLPDSIYEATLEVKSIQIERMLEALKKQEFEVLEETARRLIEL